MRSLVSRGLRGVQLLFNDDYTGFKVARKVFFYGVPWQRCQPVLAVRLEFHLLQNAGQHVFRQEMKQEVAEDLRTIFNTPERPIVEFQLAEKVKK